MKRWLVGGGSLLAFAALSGAVQAEALRVCADPGNMPLSNNKGEGFENKIAELLAKSMGMTVTYYYRPTIERGLTRSTLYAEECDLMMDMPLDTERVLTTVALYRSTFVLASRTDRHLDIKSLSDPRLKKLKIGVYQTSAMREALYGHDVYNDNVVIHYLTHDADLVPEDQPSYQVQEVLDGKLDIAAVWGPFAGWYKVTKHEPLTLTPANLMDESVQLEFDMALAVRTSDKPLREQLDKALVKEREGIRAILVEYGVPLVKCADCLVSGDLPSHGPYKVPDKPQANQIPSKVTIAQLNEWLAQGAKVDEELNHAIIADDLPRVSYLLDKKHADINAIDLQGETPLGNAVHRTSLALVKYLVDHGANVNLPDRDGWTPLMQAAWLNLGQIIQFLIDHKANPDAAGANGMTPLAIASQNGKDVAAVALVNGHADANQVIGAGYTPLMLAVADHSTATTQALITHGANVNAKNQGGVTALMIAAFQDQANLASILVKAGADISARNENGETALSIAQQHDRQSVLKVLEPHPGSAVSNSGATGS
jgi:quinoprotein dehydrogenase-associated probable ABC transporter substrate-binding protein